MCAQHHIHEVDKASAQSWGKQAVFDELTKLEAAYDASRAAARAEEWQVNPAIHYNAWASFNKKDFEPVVKAFKDLLMHFSCSSCNSLYHMIPEREEAQGMRCMCATVNINLITKPKTKAA